MNPLSFQSRALRTRGLLLLSTLVLSGCLTTGIGAPPPDAGKNEEELKKEIYHLSKQMAELKEADERNRSANAGLSQRVSSLENELSKARGELEKAQNQNKRMTEQMVVLEKKSAVSAPPPPPPPASNAGAPPEVTGPSPAAMLAGETGTPPPAKSATEASRVQTLTALAKQEEQGGKAPSAATYESAFLLLKSGQFEKSLDEFQQFLKVRPNDELADNAQYWVGELYLAQKKYPDALTAFNQVLVRWPASDKVPPSLLKIGYAFDEMGDHENARISLEKLVKDFPEAPSVPHAKQRLKMINEAHPAKKK